MNAEAMRTYSLILSEKERTTLQEVLEELVKETRVELHRTERFAAQRVVQSRESTLESLLAKVRASRPE